MILGAILWMIDLGRERGSLEARLREILEGSRSFATLDIEF